MKKLLTFVMGALLLSSAPAMAQNAKKAQNAPKEKKEAAKPAKPELKYYDARQFPLLGSPVERQQRNAFVRLPDSLETKVDDNLWRWGNSPAGMSIRFCSDATQIGVKFVTATKFQMNHMTYTGIHGVDLYMLNDEGKWEFLAAGRPAEGNRNVKRTLMSNMTKKEREYMLFLPLYDGLDSLVIGVDSASYVTQPKKQLINRQRPIIAYSTSIGQGGCASRPGMVHTAIMQRELQREIINFGFSGGAQLQTPFAEVMGSVEAGMYIIDCLPNCTSKMLQERLIPFVDILRKKHPEVPILFVESPIFPVCIHDQVTGKDIRDKNAVYRGLFEQLQQRGEKNIYYFYGDQIIGDEWDNTVDNYHFTDKGFVRFAKVLEPVIEAHALK